MYIYPNLIFCVEEFTPGLHDLHGGLWEQKLGNIDHPSSLGLKLFFFLLLTTALKAPTTKLVSNVADSSK